MRPDQRIDTLVDDELDVLAGLVPIARQDIIELGCGAAGGSAGCPAAGIV